MKCFGKMLLTALAGWAALNVAILLTFRLIGFGFDGHGVLMNPQTQSAKLIAVWSELPPLPRIVAQPASMIIGMYGFAFLHAVIYRMLSPAWTSGIWSRGLRLSGLLFGVCYSFWEFFTPFNLFGEPWPLIGVELLFWAAVALAEGLAIAAVAERMWPADKFVARLSASEQTGASSGCHRTEECCPVSASS
jgi:hypothetical protein